MWTIEGQARELGPGESVCIPRGQIHEVENRGSVDAKFLSQPAACSGQPTCATSPGSSPPRRADRPIWPRSAK
jgi:quercetin dioxygenase-like cupin family protein